MERGCLLKVGGGGEWEGGYLFICEEICGVLLSPMWLLLEEQVAGLGKMAFVQLYVAGQFIPFLDWEAVLKVITPCSPPWLDLSTAKRFTRGWLWRVFRIFSWCKIHRCSVRVTPLLREMYWLPLCFWVQYVVLAVNFKAIHGLGLCYLKGSSLPNCICPSC